MKKLLSVALVVCSAGLLGACGSSGESTAQGCESGGMCITTNEMAVNTPTPAQSASNAQWQRFSQATGRYMNASPSGFDNSGAWMRTGTFASAGQE